MLTERIRICVQNLTSSIGLLHPDDLAARLGLTVVRVPMRSVRGMVLGPSLIGVNAEMPLPWQHGVVLHECGHRVLHPEESRFFLERATFQLLSRRELETSIFVLLYLLEWDRLSFEECGADLARFAAFYGLPRQAVDAVLRSIQTGFGKRLCG